MKIYFTVILILFSLTFLHSRVSAFELLATTAGEADSDQFGISVSSAGDVNHDGYDDIIVGADANDEAGNCAGKVYIFLGGPNIDSIPDVQILGRSGEFFGVSVSCAGDVNQDGYDDVIIGAHFNSELATRAGRAAIYFGGSPMDTIVDVVMYGENALDYFGISVSSAGDVNHDGYDDVIVGAYKHDSPTMDNVGKAYIYFGGEVMDSIPDVTITGTNDGERFGRSVSCAGDVNNDLYDDVVVGAYSYDEGVQINLGRSYVFLGGSPMDTIPDVVMTGGTDNEYFGWSVSDAGDVNYDNYGDVIVGAYGYTYGDTTNAGKIYLFHGGLPMDNSPDFVADAGRAQTDHFGFSVSSAKDINSDSYDDFLVGAKGDDDAGADAGKVHVFYGGESVSPEADMILLGENAGDQFGHCLASAADVNQDDSSEVVIGAWAWNNSTGKIYVYGSSPTANQAPVLDSIGAKSVDEGQTLEFRVSATDPDGDSIILGAENRPTNATFVDSGNGAGSFTFSPDSTQAGLYNVTFTASDGSSSDSEVVSITVNDVNQEPLRGDANGDGTINVGDVVYLVSYLYRGGAEPTPLWTGDCNCDEIINLGDIVYLVSYLYKGGPPPGCP
ncbi:MAG: Ig-like domain-containing protein [Candidatus Zixiibacteriota bacterium]